MTDPRVPQLAAISYALYRILVLAYPREFRREFGDEMVQVFSQCCEDAYRRYGAVGLGKVWIHTLIDMVENVAQEYALLERMQALALPTTAGRQAAHLGDTAVYACPFCGEEIQRDWQRCVYCAGDLTLCPPRHQKRFAPMPRKTPGYSAVQLATDAQRFYDWAHGEPTHRD